MCASKKKFFPLSVDPFKKDYLVKESTSDVSNLYFIENMRKNMDVCPITLIELYVNKFINILETVGRLCIKCLLCVLKYFFYLILIFLDDLHKFGETVLREV